MTRKQGEDMSKPRIGVYVCQCGSNIAATVDTEAVAKFAEGLDGVVLAAAGIKRLGIDYPRVIELPVDRFLPAPAQGALAVQTRTGTPAAELAAVLDHQPSRRTVTAERSFLREINAGCHTPTGALAQTTGDRISLHARLFSDDYARVVEGVESHSDPVAAGVNLARRLLSELGGQA